MWRGTFFRVFRSTRPSWISPIANEPVEKHPKCRQVLLHCRLGVRALQILDISCNVYRFDFSQIEQPASFAPVGKTAHSLVVRPPRVSIANVCREEFPEAF